MRYVKMAIACGLLGLAPSLAYAATPAASEDTVKIQLQHVVIVTETCRSEADTIVVALETVAREKHTVAFYNIMGPGGVKVPVTKETFADYYMLTCFPQKALADPVLTGAPDISAELPGI